MRQAPRRSCSIASGISAPRDERRTAAHSVPATAPYWPNQSNGPCQGRSVGSEDQSSNHRGHGRPPTFSLTFSPSRSFPFPGTARAYYGRINHRRAGVPWPVRARTTVGVILRGAPRQQEQQPAGFHGGLPAHLFQWRLSSCLRRRHAMPCRRSCCLAPTTPPQLAPSIDSFRPWRRRVSA